MYPYVGIVHTDIRSDGISMISDGLNTLTRQPHGLQMNPPGNRFTAPLQSVPSELKLMNEHLLS